MHAQQPTNPPPHTQLRIHTIHDAAHNAASHHCVAPSVRIGAVSAVHSASGGMCPHGIGYSSGARCFVLGRQAEPLSHVPRRRPHPPH
eukprot:206449-Pyramimonas_sp.AAC.1